MKAYADASIMDGYSVHSYILYDKDKHVLMRYQDRGSEHDTIRAEMVSIIRLLEQCKRNYITDIKIYTDCSSVLHFLDACKKGTLKNRHKGYIDTHTKRLLKLLNSVQGEICWIRREYNHVAHRMCNDFIKGKSSAGLTTSQKIKDRMQYIIRLREQGMYRDQVMKKVSTEYCERATSISL